MRFPGLASVVRNSGYLLGGQAAFIATRAIYLVILASWLTPTSYGALTYGLSWYLAFIGLTSLGLDVVLGRDVGRDRSDGPTLAATALVLRALAILATLLISTSAAVLIETDSTARSVILVSSFALVGRGLWLWCASVFIAFETARRVMILDFVFRSLELCALLLYLFNAKPDVIGIAIIHGLTWCCQAFVAVLIIRTQVTSLDFRLVRARSVSLLVQGVPAAFYTFGVTFFLQAPIVLYRQTSGIGDALGNFALAYQVVGYLQVVPYLVGSAALPVLSRSAARRDGKNRRIAILMLTLVPAVGALLALVGTLASAPIVRLVFGSQYTPTAVILIEAVWLLIPIGIAIFLQQFVFSTASRSPLATLSPLVGAAVMTASFVPLTARFDYHGALFATGLGMSVWALCLMVALVGADFFKPRFDAPDVG